MVSLLLSNHLVFCLLAIIYLIDLFPDIFSAVIAISITNYHKNQDPHSHNHHDHHQHHQQHHQHHHHHHHHYLRSNNKYNLTRTTNRTSAVSVPRREGEGPSAVVTKKEKRGEPGQLQPQQGQGQNNDYDDSYNDDNMCPLASNNTIKLCGTMDGVNNVRCNGIKGTKTRQNNFFFQFWNEGAALKLERSDQGDDRVTLIFPNGQPFEGISWNDNGITIQVGR